WAYARSRLVRQQLERHRIRYLTTKPYRPRTNGKDERLHQTMAREWAYGLVYRSHHDRATALPHWLHHYNTARPHSSLGRATPDPARSQRLWAGQLAGSAAADVRALAPERRIGERLKRLVELRELARDPQHPLVRLEPAVDRGDLLRQTVETLEQRVELAVGDVPGLHRRDSRSI